MPEITDYTVGWICAIGAEYVAAQEFLDEEHPPLSEQHPNDDNIYTLGTISKHNVVIACLPDGSYGTNSAAAVARDLLRTFPNIKFGLMVGIGGGCPSPKRDIRLGDVVVSSVSGNAGAVLQYDYGKAIQDNEFKLTKHLDGPPQLLAAAVQNLRALHKRRGNGLNKTVASALEKNRRLKREFTRPEAASDRLFQSTFRHIDPEEACESTCALQEDRLIPRADRDEDEDDITTVHYGLIASGNSLIKSAKLRDELVAEKDVLCFEMEAAGLMDHFKCLVIRGVCDYCDTHKNNDWQGYAAMVAAAYAKDLLGRIPPSKVASEQSMKLSEISRDTQEIKSLAAETKDYVAELANRSQVNDVREWLSPPDPSTDFHEALKQRHANTGKWFLQSKKYQDWRTTSHAFLWLYARPGAGKTVLSSTIIENLRASEVEVRTTLFFYFTFRDTSKQTLQSMLSSLVYQLYTNVPATQDLVHAAKGSSTPPIPVLLSLFKDMTRKIGSANIVLDALDECPPEGGANRELIAWIKDCKTWEVDLRILVTSRYENHIRSQFQDWAESFETLELNAEHTENDIASYIHYAVRDHGGLKRWQKREDVQTEIEDSLAKKADGVFRWVSCQLTVLESCKSLVTLRRAMRKLPRTLNETYLRILNAIPEEDQPYTVRILQLLAYSENSMELNALIDALAVEIGQEPAFTEEHRIEDPREVVAYFSGLARLVPLEGPYDRYLGTTYEVQLAHFSVKEWLVQSTPGDSVTWPEFDEFNARESICMVYLSYLCEVDHERTGVDYQLFGHNGLQRVTPRARPLTQIASSGWVDHARLISDKSSDVRSKAAELLQGRSLFFYPELCNSAWPNQDMLDHDVLAYALVQACHYGLPAIADDLIRRGAVPEGHAGCHRTPLQAAAAGGSIEVVQLLVNKYKVALDQFCRHEAPATALAIACHKGHEAIIQFLLDQGANPNARREPQPTPLQQACEEASSEIAALLLAYGADPNFEGPEGDALHYACRAKTREVVQLLLKNGANVQARDSSGSTALQYACYHSFNREIVQTLLDSGADCKASGGNRGSALRIAASKWDLNLFEMLLGHCGDEEEAEQCRQARLYESLYEHDF
ncbi:hypothetical protein CC79DRAFT_1313249 [Sarocladium strictum]